MTQHDLDPSVWATTNNYYAAQFKDYGDMISIA